MLCSTAGFLTAFLEKNFPFCLDAELLVKLVKTWCNWLHLKQAFIHVILTSMNYSGSNPPTPYHILQEQGTREAVREATRSTLHEHPISSTSQPFLPQRPSRTPPHVQQLQSQHKEDYPPAVTHRLPCHNKLCKKLNTAAIRWRFQALVPQQGVQKQKKLQADNEPVLF